MIMAVDARSRDDSPNGVCVVNKVLAEGLTRSEVNLFRQMSYLGPPE